MTKGEIYDDLRRIFGDDFIPIDEAEDNNKYDNFDSVKRTSGKNGVMSSIIFYTVIICMVFASFVYSQRNNKGTALFNYSYFNVLSDSMQSAVPVGSLILVKSVDGSEIEVGDDITFFREEDTIITHRVIEITEDYEDSGQRGFRTKGTDNLEADRTITYEGNVIGKVVWHIPYLGFFLEYIARKPGLVLMFFGFLTVLGFILQLLRKSSEKTA